MADVSRSSERQPPQPARSDHHDERQPPRPCLDVPGARRSGSPAGDPRRRRRAHVRHRGERRLGAGREDRAAGLALQPAAHAGARRRFGVGHQSGRGRARRSRLPADRSRAPHRAASHRRPAAVGRRDGGLPPALRRHQRAAGRQRSGDRRRVRRRRGHPRLPRCLQGDDRRACVAVLDGAGAAANRDPRRGSARPASMGALRRGSRAPTIPTRSCSTGRPAIHAPTTTATNAAETTSIRTRCWRSIRTPAGSRGTSSSRRTTCTTGTPPRRRCWSTRTSAAVSASCCSMPTATDSSTCSTGSPASCCARSRSSAI